MGAREVAMRNGLRRLGWVCVPAAAAAVALLWRAADAERTGLAADAPEKEMVSAAGGVEASGAGDEGRDAGVEIRAAAAEAGRGPALVVGNYDEGTWSVEPALASGGRLEDPGFRWGRAVEVTISNRQSGAAERLTVAFELARPEAWLDPDFGTALRQIEDWWAPEADGRGDWIAFLERCAEVEAYLEGRKKYGYSALAKIQRGLERVESPPARLVEVFADAMRGALLGATMPGAEGSGPQPGELPEFEKVRSEYMARMAAGKAYAPPPPMEGWDFRRGTGSRAYFAQALAGFDADEGERVARRGQEEHRAAWEKRLQEKRAGQVADLVRAAAGGKLLPGGMGMLGREEIEVTAEALAPLSRSGPGTAPAEWLAAAGCAWDLGEALPEAKEAVAREICEKLAVRIDAGGILASDAVELLSGLPDGLAEALPREGAETLAGALERRADELTVVELPERAPEIFALAGEALLERALADYVAMVSGGSDDLAARAREYLPEGARRRDTHLGAAAAIFGAVVPGGAATATGLERCRLLERHAEALATGMRGGEEYEAALRFEGWP